MASSPPDHSPLYAPLYPSRSANTHSSTAPDSCNLPTPLSPNWSAATTAVPSLPRPARRRMRERSPDFVEGNYMYPIDNNAPLTPPARNPPNERHTRRIAQAITRQFSSSFKTDQPALALRVLQHIGFEEALRRGFRRSPQLILLVANGQSEISAETLRISFTPLELR
ncbi:hypothetical protein BASA50_003559 [Batrachochytrium salamandrivorans]|uniref:Uncharacterized protein n=1 Tax=Batrachochytrium salamandrivorans TaxID=1357716 RepID=A0ABQ8FHZ9_9FUNG|nr:hypothetical protein BASA62_006448 [Batrachochytrium salamandrivorans]KAH6569376.1 hypothetical protein BASA60_008209 [Batrachochytrium salamandrivorans]KAH6598520.1 hypothetical protein BASA50_003559 [Batrachochytrium salamandrivorans]KAH6600299.1 hypothetical protein BASA61_002302 [Batrachochytrium salamandrivorans]KAH9250008.1 hypothetical protein BASA81_012200 [Batrachochytrium salamandrivorans]